jgi:hypothetical protein
MRRRRVGKIVHRGLSPGGKRAFYARLWRGYGAQDFAHADGWYGAPLPTLPSAAEVIV